jgi:tetratricopeptide (TPR) repeat protein
MRGRDKEPAATPPRYHVTSYLSIIVATALVYQPVWHGAMLWDDDRHITSAALQSIEGLWRIWFELGATQQYYPVTHSVFWLQNRLWGDSTLGYHLVSIICHGVSACLFLVILRRLAVPGALLAAWIFALHPVHVESVAWISELKNTLSGMLFLLAVWFYLKFDSSRSPRLYFATVAIFALALLSKSVTAVLPAALLVLAWWRHGRIDWSRDGLPLAPMFVVGAVSGLWTAWVERSIIGASGADFQLTLVERLLLATRALLFYPGKLIWPTELLFTYPRWEISQHDPMQYLYPIVVASAIAMAWYFRRQSSAPAAAIGLFVVLLFPAMGFFNVYPFRFSFVADHFQYLASLPAIALLSAAVLRGAQAIRLPSLGRNVAAAILVSVLAATTTIQAGLYTDPQTLYSHTLRHNPSAWMAHNNLGIITMPHDPSGAAEHFNSALRLRPDLAEAAHNLGHLAHQAGRLADALSRYDEALRSKPDLAEAHNGRCAALQGLGRITDAANACLSALRIRPDYADAHMNLGAALYALGNIVGARDHFREALRLQPGSAAAQVNLARVEAEINRQRR